MRFKGAPVDVGMSIDIASIDMVSEVNMVSSLAYKMFFLKGDVPRATHVSVRTQNT